jgi:hypothetical protein
MGEVSNEAAASFLEEYAMRLHGMSGLKWTGEFDTGAGIEARLLVIAAALRGTASGSHARLGHDDAQFLRSQAESLRGPNRLVLDDPLITAEWRQISETTFETADRLEAIAELIMQRLP